MAESTPKTEPAPEKHPAQVRIDNARVLLQAGELSEDGFFVEVVRAAYMFATTEALGEAVAAVCYLPPKFYEKVLYGIISNDPEIASEVVALARILESEGVDFVRTPPEVATQKVGLA